MMKSKGNRNSIGTTTYIKTYNIELGKWQNTARHLQFIKKMSALFGCSLDDLLKEAIKLTTKIFKTLTYANGMKDNLPRLKIQTEKKTLIAKGVEVMASVNMETGEVNFFIEQEDLEKLK